MKKLYRIQEALQVLLDNSYVWGIDKKVDDPVSVLTGTFKISKPAAYNHLKELETRRIISASRTGRGRDGGIDSVRILKTQVEAPDLRKDMQERVLVVLEKYKRGNGQSSVVSQIFFPNIAQDAKIPVISLYPILNYFATEGFINIVRQPNSPRFIDHIVLINLPAASFSLLVTKHRK